MENDDWYEEYKKCVMRNEIKSAMEISNNNFPKHLYRFSSFFNDEKWHNDIFDNVVEISKPSSFNDPFDCEIAMDNSIMKSNIIKKILLKNLEQHHIKLKPRDLNRIKFSDNCIDAIQTIAEQHGSQVNERNLYKSCIQDAITEVKKTTNILCFTNSVESICMWSHYTYRHEGYCIRYNFVSDNIVNPIYPVVYATKRPVVDGHQIDNEGNWIFPQLICKAKQWEYEHEWRLILLNQNKFPLQKNSKTISVNFKGFVDGIYLGTNIYWKHEREIVEKYAERQIPVYKMKKSSSEYKLIPEQIC